MHFADIPESITRHDRDALIAALGLGTISDLQMLEFRPDGVHAVVFARHRDGAIALDTVAGKALTHKIYIPVKD